MEIGKKQKISLKAIIFLVVFGIVTGSFNLLSSRVIFGGEHRNMESYGYQVVFFTLLMMFLFMFLVPKLNRRLVRKIKLKTKENEVVEYEGVANIRMQFMKSVGKLFLTNQRICYQSRKAKKESDLISLPYDEVQKVEKCKTSFIVDSSLRIITKGGEEYIFNVYDREVWFEKLNEQINKYAH